MKTKGKVLIFRFAFFSLCGYLFFFFCLILCCEHIFFLISCAYSLSVFSHTHTHIQNGTLNHLQIKNVYAIFWATTTKKVFNLKVHFSEVSVSIKYCVHKLASSKSNFQFRSNRARSFKMELRDTRWKQPIILHTRE